MVDDDDENNNEMNPFSFIKYLYLYLDCFVSKFDCKFQTNFNGFDNDNELKNENGFYLLPSNI